MRKRSKLLTAALVVFTILTSVYLLRWPLTGGIVEEAVRDLLAESLDIDAVCEDFSGSFVTGIRIGRITGRAVDETGVLRDLTVLDVHIDGSSLDILRGRLSGITVTIDRAYIAIDADRGGDEEPDPFVLPDDLPLITIHDADIFIASGDNEALIEGLALELGAPDGDGFQAGHASAYWISLTTGGDERHTGGLSCPLVYGNGRAEVGPLHVDGYENLLHAKLDFSGDAADTRDNAIRFDVLARPWEGAVRCEGEIVATLGGPYDLEFELRDIDLSHLAGPLSFTAGTPLPVSGLMTAEGSAGGLLGRPESLVAELRGRIDLAGYDRSPPFDVLLEGGVLEGRLACPRLAAAGSSGWIEMQGAEVATLESEIQVRIESLEGRIEAEEFAFLEPLSFTIAPEITTVESAVLEWRSGRLSLEGTLADGSILDLRASAAGLDSSLLARFWPEESPHPTPTWDELTFDAEITGPIDAPHARLSGDMAGLHYRGAEVTRSRLAAVVTPGRVTVQNLSLETPRGGILLGRAVWETGDGGLPSAPRYLEAELETTDLDLRTFLPFWAEGAGIEGSLTASLSVKGPPDHPAVTLTARSRILSLPDKVVATVPSAAERANSWDLDLSMQCTAGTMTLERLAYESESGRFHAGGKLPFDLGWDDEGLRFGTTPDAVASAEARFERFPVALIPVDISGLEGLASGTAALSGPWSFPEASIECSVQEFAYLGQVPGTLTGRCVLENGILKLEKARLVREGEVVLDGRADLDLNDPSGGVLAQPGPNTRINVECTVNGEPVAAYAAQAGYEATGRLSMTVRGGGTLADPRYETALHVEDCLVSIPEEYAESVLDDPEVADLPVDINASIILGADSLIVEKISTEAYESTTEYTGSLPVGIGWDRLEQRRIVDRDGPIDLRFEGRGLRLGSLTNFIPDAKRLKGAMSCEGSIGGTLAEPIVEGRFHLRDGAWRIDPDIPSFEEIDADLFVNAGGITIERFDATMGAGPLQVAGEITWAGPEPAGFDLRFTGEDVLLFRGGGVKVRADVDTAFTGPFDSPLLSGNVTLTESKVVTRVPMFTTQGPPTVEGPKTIFELEGDFGRSVRFDVAVKTGRGTPVVVENNVFRGRLVADLTLKGTGAVPYLLGTVTYHDSLLKLPNFLFRVDSGSLTFRKSDPFTPWIDCVAHGRRQSLDVDLVVKGPADNVTIYLSSQPPLDEEDLAVLVSTGILPERISEQALGGQAAKILGTYLGEELIYEFFGSQTTESGESVADRFELSIGTEVSPDGRDNYILEYRLAGPWHVQGEYDIYYDSNVGIVYRIRFR